MLSETPGKYFGLTIAYGLPGFIALGALVPLLPAVSRWLYPSGGGDAGLASPVYVLLAAMTAGMIVSCVRWLLIDTLHHATGLSQPVWNDGRLGDRLQAFNYLVEVHYRYYQFYANALVAILLAYGVNRVLHTIPLLGFGTDLAVVILVAVLFAGSRDALAKYYRRTTRLVGHAAEKGGSIMTNGNHASHESGASASPARATPKLQEKPTTPAKPQSPKDKAAEASK